MSQILTRVAALAFPASALVIIQAYLLEQLAGVSLPEQVTAAETGLLTWAAAVLLGAGLKKE